MLGLCPLPLGLVGLALGGKGAIFGLAVITIPGQGDCVGVVAEGFPLSGWEEREQM